VADSLRVACLQVNAGNDMAANIAATAALAREAARGGAQFIATPENVVMMAAGGKETRAKAQPEDSHEALAAFRDLARETNAWFLVGSLACALPSGKLANRSILLDPQGRTVGRYDKIHMFDVDLPSGESYRESSNYEPGLEGIMAETPWGRVGMTICYDVRFPYLYRALAKLGSRIITVPSAFTRVTGEAHWHVLLRARAIETGCFVVAPAMTGEHPAGRKTYGHSLVVSPWGEVLADGGTAVGVVFADLDLGAIDTARASVPSLKHDRGYTPPSVFKVAG
jgi:predicted amidohydrolase